MVSISTRWRSELAKLSIWLVTFAKGRPFGFLDHNFRQGDSLLGITSILQLTELNMSPGVNDQYRLFGQNIEEKILEDIDLRIQIRSRPIRDIRDVNHMASLNEEAQLRLELPKYVADALIFLTLDGIDRPTTLESSLAGLASIAEQSITGDSHAVSMLTDTSNRGPKQNAKQIRYSRPFHWPLEYPDVFLGDGVGFDAVLSNPPWGAALLPGVQNLWKNLDGDKLDRLADLFHLFVIRTSQILSRTKPAFAG